MYFLNLGVKELSPGQTDASCWVQHWWITLQHVEQGWPNEPDIVQHMWPSWWKGGIGKIWKSVKRVWKSFFPISPFHQEGHILLHDLAPICCIRLARASHSMIAVEDDTAKPRARNGDRYSRQKWFDWRPDVFKRSPNWRLVQNERRS